MGTFVRPTVQDAAAGVIVRRYPSAAAYQLEVGPLAAIGWAPVSQVETNGQFPPAAGILVLLGIMGMLFVNLIGGLVLFVVGIGVGVVARPKAFVVTYRYDAGRAP